MIRNTALILACFGILIGARAQAAPADAGPETFTLDTFSEWKSHQAASDGAAPEKTHNIGGKFDLMGNGALLLQKTDPSKPFWKTDTFVNTGSWTSKWVDIPGGESIGEIRTDILVYGQQQDMTKGWVKFSGNPLVCAHGWKHATGQSLQLPRHCSDWPADQSLVRGRREWEGKWLLLFNVGAWARKGFGMAVADSLSPLKKGVNSFQISDPHPLFKGTGGKNAPNDWIEIGGTWYLPDETKKDDPHLWTSPDLREWTNHGPIEGINGHDPGMCFDGERFYLFNEYETGIAYCSAVDPLGEWTPHGAAFETGEHCGDADVSFFNNRWHMTYDDNPHRHYMIGYACTTPSEFPAGWQLTRKFFGPHLPEQGQLWDDDTPEGNNFGTGDADLALEDTTLYMTYEFPVGIAYKELELHDGDEQTVRVMVEVDDDRDGEPDRSSGWQTLSTGETTTALKPMKGKRARISFQLETRNPGESPMIRECRIGPASKQRLE